MKTSTLFNTGVAVLLGISFATTAKAELGDSIGIALSVQAGNTTRNYLDTNDPIYSNSYEHQLSQQTNQVIERLGFDDHQNLITYYMHEIASATTSASLYTGQLKAIAKGSPPIQFFDSGGNTYWHNYSQSYTHAQMRDVLHFQIPLALFDNNNFAHIPLSLEFEGSITGGAESFGSASYWVYLSGSGFGTNLTFQNSFQKDSVGNLTPYNNGITVDFTRDGGVDLTTTDNMHWNGALPVHLSSGVISGDSALFTGDFFSQLSTSAAGSFVAYGNTAGITFNLPEGVLLTSDSGVFLTAAAVPEPETYAMLLAGLGLVGFTVRRKGKNKAAN